MLPARALAADGPLPQEVQISIRPQSIHLLREKPAERDERCTVEASIQRRSYLGESWDYHITMAASAEPIRVSARPAIVFEVGQKIYAEIDTSQITVLHWNRKTSPYAASPRRHPASSTSPTSWRGPTAPWRWATWAPRSSSSKA